MYVFYAQSFYPARQNGRKSEDWPQLAGWLSKSKKVTLKRDEADAWFSAHGDSVRSKVEAYWPKWLEKSNRPIVQPEDGVKTVDELRKP